MKIGDQHQIELINSIWSKQGLYSARMQISLQRAVKLLCNSTEYDSKNTRQHIELKKTQHRSEQHIKMPTIHE